MFDRWLYKRSFSLFKKALEEYSLLQDKEKVLVGVSGGADSIVLAHLFSVYNLRRNKNWNLLAVHIDPGFPDWNTRKIVKFFEEIKIPYIISKIDVPKKLAQINKRKQKYCFFCSRQRRKRLFEIADQQGIKKIALAHHLEDVNETFLLNLFYASEITTFVPKQEFFQNRFYIIRPLYFFDKTLILNYLKGHGLRPINNHCPYENIGERNRIRKFLNQLYKKDPRIKTNIFWGIKNIKINYLP
ncbi:MAG: tRNA 2-thiocytidine biosynthesis TtcA family protein [candidate division WOR-3 bacterium]|nr:tRNA 2-thiocytidine biosynthesis TtcA family protein [candidate division WOR-3 bacterium]